MHRHKNHNINKLKLRNQIKQWGKKRCHKFSRDERWKCPICLDSLKEPVVSQCGHVFCWPCIYRWLRQSHTCPLCHCVLTEEKLIPIYGQGPEADLKIPPPPRPEYQEPDPEDTMLEATILDRDDFVFPRSYSSDTPIPSLRTIISPSPELAFQIVAMIFFILSFILH